MTVENVKKHAQNDEADKKINKSHSVENQQKNVCASEDGNNKKIDDVSKKDEK